MNPPVRRTSAVIVALLLIVLAVGCGKKSETATSLPASTPAAKPANQSEFERDLDYVRTGQFAYVLVFSRKDGAVFSNEDIQYLKANSPAETNQWIRTDEGKRVIAGTNFEFKQEHLDALNQRFNVENRSGK